MIELHHANCLDVLRNMKDESVDSIVTDPPYGLSFMGKKWDYDVPSVEIWEECFRVLKSGGHLISFSSARTYHRLAVNIEDAGFEIRDQIMWVYGSGFPKSHNISKAIDKAAGADRKIIGVSDNVRPNSNRGNGLAHGEYGRVWNETTPTTHEAQEWEGWGTALKPAHEPMVLARKPFKGTVANNVLTNGTGGLNIDGCRVHHDDPDIQRKKFDNPAGMFTNPNREGERGAGPAPEGRFPANFIHDGSDEVVSLFPQTKSTKRPPSANADTGNGLTHGKMKGLATERGFNDDGSAARFFYCAKANKKERNLGLEGSNNHPCVKPVALMEYLCRMITPPNGVVLDPFMGSGSTGIATQNEGFSFIGIDMDRDYIDIACQRIKHWSEKQVWITRWENGKKIVS